MDSEPIKLRLNDDQRDAIRAVFPPKAAASMKPLCPPDMRPSCLVRPAVDRRAEVIDLARERCRIDREMICAQRHLAAALDRLTAQLRYDSTNPNIVGVEATIDPDTNT